jgi:dTDP-4-amino-4,6-dideoxygalactose transaminase
MSEISAPATSIAQMSAGAFFLQHRSEIEAALMRVVDSGWYVLGKELEVFEREFAQHFGLAAAAGVASGTDALALALRSVGVGPNDRVATVSHTAVATVAAIEMIGACPLLVDIDPLTYTLDPLSLERTVASVGPVKAVIAVHLYGHPAAMPAINTVAQACRASVVEDCAQAHGAVLDGRSVGGMGAVSAFSFYPTKNLGALGDGGMVASNDPAVIECVRSLREYGWQRRYVSQIPGVNSRLDELQAAVLRVRLTYLDAANARRRAIAARYSGGLARLGVVVPSEVSGARHVYHQYVVRHPQRNYIQRSLREQGIATNIHYPVPVHRQPAYASRCLTDPLGLPASEQAAEEILSLPMYPELQDAEVDAVIGAMERAIASL